jgi:phosphatidylglycerophosphate synthase
MTKRRPLKSRQVHVFHRIAHALVKRGLRANHVSMSSLLWAVLAFLCFALSASSPFWLLGAAFFVQLRLLANLLDGLMAVEAGDKHPHGPFWNEFPDRPADVLILFGLGLAAGQTTLGLLCGLLALGTAYTRALGLTLTGTDDFSGFMAKPQRMFVVTLACVLGLGEMLIWSTTESLTGALWVVALGSAFTIVTRAQGIKKTLSEKEQEQSL